MITKAREAWQKLYSKHGLQYGGSGDIGPLEDILKPGMLVLDAGCGDGKTTEVIARICEVVGCDFSREGLLTLRMQRDYDRIANLVECELGNLPFESEKFDAITCIHALSHSAEAHRAKASKEMVRTLKPGGHLLVEAFGKGDLRYGEGDRAEESSFVRGNGILTHYFAEGELPALFDGMVLQFETFAKRRVTYGAVAGKREIIRAWLRKPA